MGFYQAVGLVLILICLNECKMAKMRGKRPKESVKEVWERNLHEMEAPGGHKKSAHVGFRSFLKNPQVVHIFPGAGSRTGVATLNGKLYISKFQQSNIEVYETSSFAEVGNISVSNTMYSRDLVASSQCNCLYLSDEHGTYGYLHRIDLESPERSGSGRYIGAQYIDARPSGLSLTKDHYPLLTIANTHQLLEYTEDGDLVKTINLEDDIDWPTHAIKLSGDRYAVSQSSLRTERVVIADSDGKLIKSYGGPNRNLTVVEPHHLAVDSSGNILVADMYHSKVQLLSPELEHIGDVDLATYNLIRPDKLHFDEANGLLYVSESYGRLFVLKPE